MQLRFVCCRNGEVGMVKGGGEGGGGGFDL
jgi:hypothetical protein